MTARQALAAWSDWRFNGSRSEPLTPGGYASNGSAAGGGRPDLSGLRGFLAVEDAIDEAMRPVITARRVIRRSALVRSLRLVWHDGAQSADADAWHVGSVGYDDAKDDQYRFDEALEQVCAALAEESRGWLRIVE